VGPQLPWPHLRGALCDHRTGPTGERRSLLKLSSRDPSSANTSKALPYSPAFGRPVGRRSRLTNPAVQRGSAAMLTPRLSRTDRRRRERIDRSAALLLALALSLGIALRVGATEIIHVDLKQPGAAAVILQPTPTGVKVIVVDFGKYSPTPTAGSGKLVSVLKRLSIDHVDLGLVTHTDSDHVGGIQGFLSPATAASSSDPRSWPQTNRGPPAFPISAVVEPGLPPKTVTGRRFLERLEYYHVPQVTSRDAGSLRELEEAFRIRVFSNPQARTTNDSSLCVAVRDSE
jgi:hypothetical protein